MNYQDLINTIDKKIKDTIDPLTDGMYTQIQDYRFAVGERRGMLLIRDIVIKAMKEDEL